MKYFLSVYCRFRDESIYLREFIEWHLLQGVEHFYMVDHLSKDYPLGVLNPYITKGIVSYSRYTEELPRSGSGQDHSTVFIRMGNQLLSQVRGETQWLAVLDSDEFLVPAPTVRIPQLLTTFQQYPALAINWQMFGTSNVERVPPNRLLLETMTLRADRDYEMNRHVKVIIQPHLTAGMGIHNCIYVNNTHAVNTNYEPVTTSFNTPILTDKLKLHHYFSRDLEFLRTVKAPRRRAFGHSDQVLYEWDTEMNKQRDLSVIPYIEELRKRVLPPPWKEYLEANPSLKAMGITTREAVQLHWFNCVR